MTRTRNELKRSLEDIFADPETEDYFRGLIRKNVALREFYAHVFELVFRVSLHRFMHPLFGFDVVKFDEWAKTPKGESTANYVHEKWGPDALTMIYRLMGVDEEPLENIFA